MQTSIGRRNEQRELYEKNGHVLKNVNARGEAARATHYVGEDHLAVPVVGAHSAKRSNRQPSDRLDVPYGNNGGLTQKRQCGYTKQ